MAITITIFLSSCHVNLSTPMPPGLAAEGWVLIKVSCLRQCAGPGHCRLVYFPWALGGSFLGRISWAGPPWSLDTPAMASGTGRKAARVQQAHYNPAREKPQPPTTIAAPYKTTQCSMYNQAGCGGAAPAQLQHAWAPGSRPWPGCAAPACDAHA